MRNVKVGQYVQLLDAEGLEEFDAVVGDVGCVAGFPELGGDDEDIVAVAFESTGRVLAIHAHRIKYDEDYDTSHRVHTMISFLESEGKKIAEIKKEVEEKTTEGDGNEEEIKALNEALIQKRTGIRNARSSSYSDLLDRIVYLERVVHEMPGGC